MANSFFRNVLFLIFVFFSACSSIKEYNFAITEEKHAVADLKQDIDFTYQILKEGHPGLYWYITKKELDYKFDSLKNSLKEPLTTNQFYQKLVPLVAAIKCAHTSLKYPTEIIKDKKERDAIKDKVYPLDQFSYAVSEDRLFTINNKSRYKALKTGTEILEIDGKPIKEIINIISEGFSYDGYNAKPKNKRIERSFPQLYKIYFTQKDSISIKYKSDTVRETFISFYTKNKEIKKKKDSVDKVVSIPVKEKIDSLKHRGKKVNGDYQLDFKFLDQQKDIAYLKIKSFSVATANFPAFYKSCFDSIALANSNNLVIDIRNNPGGTLNASLALFAYLTDKEFIYLAKPINTGVFKAAKYDKGFKKVLYYLTGFNDNPKLYEDNEGNFFSFMKGYTPQKPNKKNYKGKVYVLINEFSFSASSLLSANLKGIKRATFVGTETGGGANQCTAGSIPVIELKNTKLSLRLGLNRMAPVYQQELYGRGVFPDVEIQSTLQDRMRNYDRELQWILTDIKTKNNVRE